MANQNFVVCALRAVCIDFDDGRSVSMPPGTIFEANVKSSQVARALARNDIRVAHPHERQPSAIHLGVDAATHSLMQAGRARRAAHETNDRPKVATPMTQRKGEAVPAESKKTQK